jgi:Tol biopolymer transport system component
MRRLAVVVALVFVAGGGAADGAPPLDRLVFMSERSGTWQLWVDDGAAVRRLTTNHEADSDPAFSPDGTKIAFVRDFGYWRRPIVVLNLDNMRERTVAWSRYSAAPRWSPDGLKIAWQVSKSYAAGGVPDGTREEIWVADAFGGEPRRIGLGIGYAEWAWSPDSRRLVYVTMAYDAPALAVVPVRGGARHVIAGGREPAWSRWGAIAFVRGGDVYVTAAGTRTPERLTRDAVEQRLPSWSPDGRRIAYVEERHGWRSAVGVMNADGSARRIIAIVAAHPSRPVWSPDGRELTFGADTGETFVVRADGRGRTRVLNGLQPDWRRLSPRWLGPR